MNVGALIGGLISIAIGIGAIWIAMPSTGTISRTWLRSQAGVLHPLIPVAFLVFGAFYVLRALGWA